MKKKKRKNNIVYSKLVIVASLFLFALMIYRTVQLGLSSEIDGINLKELASKRTTRTDTITAKRGTIYSGNGDVLAQNVSSYKLFAYLDSNRTTNPDKPQHVVDKEDTARKLSTVLDMSYEDILYRLNKDSEGLKQTYFGTAGKNLNEITKKKIEDLNLPGLDFEESFKRYYPKGQFASYTVGYAKAKSEEEPEIKGEMGIEKQYDSILKGEDGYVSYQKDLRGYRIANTPVYTKDAVQGKDIYLTIDSNIQFFIEQAISNQDVDYDWDWFTITILDAKTGAVLGTANHPSFDPNYRNITNYLDLLTSSPYEPGSTMKTFTYMAAMENGVYNGSDLYKSGVYVTTDGTEIGDHIRSGWGYISYDQGYAYSSNVAVINIIKNGMNSTMLRQYYKKLGFGKKTGIELPGENKGNLEFKYETEIFNAGFGQGILTTPIQNVKALTPLTNDGMLLKPYIVSKIVDSETGEVILENGREEIERVASHETVSKMISLMDNTVNGLGNTGSPFRVGDQMIGKTGTSQIAKENGGGYIEGKEAVITSYSGIYPKNDPQIIIYASVRKPSAGSQKPLSNAVKEITNNISKYYHNEDSSTTSLTIKSYKLDNYVNKKLESTKTNLDSIGIKYTVLGNGNKVIKQSPNSGEVISSNDNLYLITNDSNILLPDVVGLSSKVAKDLLTKLGLKVKLDGVGYVTSQSVVAGSPIVQGSELILTLNPKFSAE